MKGIAKFRITAAFLLSLLFSAAVFGQATGASAITSTNLSKEQIDKIVAKFTENEKAFRSALTDYVFNRYATVNTIGLGGQITGTFRRDSFMTFLSDGRRFERITFAPVSTLVDLVITPQDLEDLGGVNPFALEPSAIPLYNFTFLGKEKIDELNLYVFDVSPKVMPEPKESSKRLFIGRIWVDDTDLMIVKSKGKAVPEWKNNRFPVVETWRENIDGKYWFPAYASSDDELVFDNGQVIKLRMRVKYTDYKMGRSDVVIGDAEDLSTEKPQPSPSPQPGQKPGR